MKIFITLVIVVLLVVAAFLYFGGGDLAIAPKPTPGTAADGTSPKLDFSTLTTVLERDMSQIPLLLDAPRITPANAFSVKSRLGNAPAARQEYQVLAQACELIILADQEHSVRQLHDKQAQANVFNDLMSSAEAQQAHATSKRTALHAQAQADWAAYRQQTDAEVKRLLGSLPNAKR